MASPYSRWPCRGARGPRGPRGSGAALCCHTSCRGDNIIAAWCGVAGVVRPHVRCALLRLLRVIPIGPTSCTRGVALQPDQLCHPGAPRRRAQQARNSIRDPPGMAYLPCNGIGDAAFLAGRGLVARTRCPTLVRDGAMAMRLFLFMSPLTRDAAAAAARPSEGTTHKSS